MPTYEIYAAEAARLAKESFKTKVMSKLVTGPQVQIKPMPGEQRSPKE